MISVIVPVYNSEKYLNRCINSIVNQTYNDIEIILVNDGSKDNSLNICYEWAKKDSRIIVINQENQGVSSARNTGIEISKGKYISFVDSDDWIELNGYESLTKNIEIDNYDLINFSFYSEYINNIINVDFQSFYYNIVDILKNLNIIENYEYLLHTIWNKLYKSSIIKNNKIKFDKNMSLGEDFVFNMNYLKYVKNIYLSDMHIYHYECENVNSAVNTMPYTAPIYLNKMFNEFSMLLDKHNVNKTICYELIYNKYLAILKYFLFSNINIKKKKLLIKILLDIIELEIIEYSKIKNDYLSKLLRITNDTKFNLFLIKLLIKHFIELKKMNLNIFIKRILKI